MQLPTHATKQDIDAICAYLFDKPAGIAVSETSAVFGLGNLRKRKLAACELWGFVEKNDKGRIVITERGRSEAMNRGTHWTRSCLDAISSVPAYMSIIRKVVSEGNSTMTPREISSFWQLHFSSVVSKSEDVRIHQAFCCLRLLEGAALGEIRASKQGGRTRFAFDAVNIRKFLNEGENGQTQGQGPTEPEMAAGEQEAGLGAAEECERNP